MKLFGNKNKQKQNGQLESPQDLIQENLTPEAKIAHIVKADDAMCLMKMLLKELGLPSNCSHVEFVGQFAKIQREADQYRTDMRLAYENNVKNNVG